MSEIQHSDNVKRSILLIGNGPSVLNHEVGKIVDSYPLVCRFNSFKIESYEKWVGTKCDIWVTCLEKPWLLDKLHLFKKIYFPLSQKHYLELVKEIPNSECFPMSLYDKVCMMNGEYFYPSTGLLASVFFIDNDYDVILYGFDFFQKSKHHYGDNQSIGPNHSPKNELIVFNRLLKEKKVRFLEL